MKTKTKALALALCAVLLVVASVFGTLAYLTDTDEVTNTFTVGKVNILLNEFNFDNDTNTDDDRKFKIGDATEAEDRDTANKYHLLPGQSYTKDPMVTILKDSEDSYVRMIVTIENYNELLAAIPASKTVTSTDENGTETTSTETIEANAKYYANGKFLIQYLVSGWSNDVWVSTNEITVSNDGKNATYEFRYKEIVEKADLVDNNTALKKVFEVITKDDNTSEEHIGYALPALFEKIVVPGNLDNDAIAHLANVVINVEAHAIQATGFNADETKSAEDVAWEAFDNQMKQQ